MKQTEQEKILQTDPELDAELAQMAEDVPPMPADFHDKWMNAIRAEAQQVGTEEKEESGRTGFSAARWTRIFSIAAVFVFLIGGTILYRNSGGTLNGPARKNQAAATLMAAEEPVKAAGKEAMTEAAAADAEEAAEIPEVPAAPMEASADTAAEPVLSVSSARKAESVETAGSVTANGFMDSVVYEAEAYYEMNEEAAAAEADDSAEYAADEAGILPEATAFVPVTTGMPLAADTVPEMPEPEEAEEQAAEETKQEEGLLQQAGDFLKDMGRFLLAALPYLAVLAVPAAAALVIGRRKKQ